MRYLHLANPVESSAFTVCLQSLSFPLFVLVRLACTTAEQQNGQSTTGGEMGFQRPTGVDSGMWVSAARMPCLRRAGRLLPKPYSRGSEKESELPWKKRGK